MKFILTTHAKERIKERSLLFPDGLDLKPCTRKIRAKIRVWCKDFDSENTSYFIHDKNSSRPTIYICILLNEKTQLYRVVTAFKFEETIDKQFKKKKK